MGGLFDLARWRKLDQAATAEKGALPIRARFTPATADLRQTFMENGAVGRRHAPRCVLWYPRRDIQEP
jgi:hypothetical protein